jgi:hypothetical protein
VAESLNHLVLRYGEGKGAISRLFSDRRYGDEILVNLRGSSADLREILRKLNRGQESLDMAINDPQLYNNANSFLKQGPGWGIRLMNVFCSATHPFASSETAGDSGDLLMRDETVNQKPR